ncbi:MAG: NAD(P)-binding protein, partial [Myxococcales bacterium]|nr:NAD(P)-binding protein [Myxococcales bacterium]
MSADNPPSALPAFVERGGEQVSRGPFQQNATDLRAFVLRGDRQRLAALCERTFEIPSGGVIRCRPVSDAVILTFATIGELRSLDAVHREHGWMSETDVVFWVPVIVEHPEGGARRRRLAWMIPYIFVDQACAVITGREAYGFPKAFGRFEIPADPTSAGPYRVSTPVLEVHDPSTELAERRILEVREVRRRAATPASSASLTVREALSLALGDAPLSALITSLGGLPELLRDGAPVLFLRQLRDVADPSRALLQEILLAPARTTALRSVASIPGEFELELGDAASHPIARDLGLTPVSPIHAALRVDFDFAMERGQTLFLRVPQPSAPSLPAQPRRRVAVLGGGLGSLSAVFELTEQPGWEERFDITVYQLGHRLGGKGASGRNAEVAQRIEEHGLHIWFGFYENAFSMIRRCFAAAQRPPGAPLADWREAFKPHHHVVVEEALDGEFRPWTMIFPEAAGEPGDGDPSGGPIAWVQRLASATATLLETALAVSQAEPDRRPRGPGAWIENAALGALLSALQLVQKLSVAAIDDPEFAALLDRGPVTRARKQVLAQLERLIARNEEVRRPWIVIDLQLAMITGIIRDRVLARGFEAIDDLDFVAWLRSHGASELTTWSAPVRVMYDLVFGYEGGDLERPRLAAGVALRGILRMIHGYKGAVMWKMQAGMGDVVFTPLYEVLRARGVKFEFFHRVRALGLADDADRIATITVGRQATVRGGTYDPLVDVKGVGCWPDRPNYDQLIEGEALAAEGINLESAWTPWADVETRVLREGEDFDDVILGIPPAALRSIAGALIDRYPRWRTMIDEVATVCTHAIQLWTRPDLEGLGWRHGGDTTQGPIVGAYVEPTDTYADMSHLLLMEDWPKDQAPGHIAYFCGPLADPEEAPPDDHEFPERARSGVVAMAERFLDDHLGGLWPAAVDAEGRFDRALLVDLEGRPARERLASQFLRANVEPSDRYTLSLPGTIASRLPADGSGVDNLFLAGDWIDNGFNCGCIEAAVISGLQCARSIAGLDLEIPGETDAWL